MIRAWRKSGITTLGVVCFVGVLMLGSSEVAAFGGLGHIQVTAWAVENLPQGELRAFLAQRETFNSVLFGSAYPDIGYYPGHSDPQMHHAYGEYSHWSPFISEFILWIKVNDPPPWTSEESKKRVAFLLGCAAHGFQDEVFDSLFLPKASYHDHQGQEAVDPGSDGFLVSDEFLASIPAVDAPVETLVEMYNEAEISQGELSEDELALALETMQTWYIDERAGPALARMALDMYGDQLPWTAEHYMDPGVPGSLHAEIFPVTRLIEQLWKELNGELPDDDVLLFEYPESGRRLESPTPNNPGSWVSFLFGTGVKVDGLTIRWRDKSGGEVPFSRTGMTWGTPWTRVLRLMPTEALAAGATYSISLKGEVVLVSGRSVDLDYLFSFGVECDDANRLDCVDDPEPLVARLDGMEAFVAEWGASAEPERGCVGCSGSGVGPEWFLLLLGVWGRWFWKRRVAL